MSSLTQETVLDRLKSVKYPGFSRDIVSFGLVKAVSVDGNRLGVRISVTTADPAVPEQLRESVKTVLQEMQGVGAIDVVVDVVAPVTAAIQAGGAALNKIPGVKHVIAIASGKGGVGKSTVAANLAAALKASGSSTGLCDCDIYGPSIALMFGSKEHPFATPDNRIQPIERYGLKLMSMGYLLTENAPAILRGPMVTRYTQQLLQNVSWGELDYLVLDLPPGTGDIQLTIVQTVALSGAIIVTTPQEVALIDARKAAAMFEKVNVPVLGLIENMSYFLCPNDGNRYEIFGSGGGQREAERLKVPLFAQIPLEIKIRETGDNGKPVVVEAPDSPTSQLFQRAAQEIVSAIAKRN
jgi:ATP-binding protein involved in chromosome partitioning